MNVTGCARAVRAQDELSNSHQTPDAGCTRPTHIPALDGVRGLAIAMVMACHVVIGANPVTSFDYALVDVAACGWLGVDLFFVLSGFLITGILVDTRNRRAYFRNFYMRRTLRIFPLYYTILVAFVAVVPIVSRAVRSNAEFTTVIDNQVWFWTYTTNILIAIEGTWDCVGGTIGHFWSLAVEEQYYLLWPFVVFFCPPNRLMRVCATIVVATLTLRIAMRFAGTTCLGIYTLMPARADALAAGGWLAVAVRSQVNLQPLRRIACLILPVSAMAVVAMFPHLRTADTLDVQTIGYTTIALGSAALILLSLDSCGRQTAFGRVFSHPVLRFFGKYSYAMYCLHPILQEGLKEIGVTAGRIPGIDAGFKLTVGVYALCVFVVSIVASLVSWHLLEKHFIRLKESFTVERSELVPLRFDRSSGSQCSAKTAQDAGATSPRHSNR